MTATTMHFGPEWMRPKHSSRPQNPSSPPPTISQASPGMSSYSSLVTPHSNTPQEKPDIVNPFRYSKEDLLRIYRERSGQSGLGLEVERWEGVVREVGNDPIAMKEWDEAEKKLFAGPLNSEVRRRQSSDYLSSPVGTQSLERNKLMREQSGTGSPMRERFGNLIGRRREVSDQPSLTVPRKLSLSTTQNTIISSRDGGLSSPRSRGPLTPGFDGVLNAGESWTSRRKRSESGSKAGTYLRGDGEPEPYDKGHEIREEEEEHSTGDGRGQKPGIGNTLPSDVTAAMDSLSVKDGPHQNNNDVPVASTMAPGQNPGTASGGQPGQVPDVPHQPPGITDLASVEWSYLDPQGQIQGPFRADIMQKWYDGGYFSADLLMKRTHLDHDWTSVGELARRAMGEKLFLSPIVRDHAPPGLPHPSEQSLDGSVAASSFTAPYQPVPLRSIHTAALDSYFASGSTASNSPSSSFGVGRFAESPDPTVSAGRVGGHIFPVNGSPGGSRNGSFVADPSAFSAPRRAGYNDLPYDAFALRSGFSNAPAVGTPSVDGFGLGSQAHPSHNLWPATSGLHNGLSGRTDSIESTGPFTPSTIPGVDPTFASQAAVSRGFANGRPQNDGYGGPFGNGNIGAVNQRDLSRLGTRDPFLHEEKRDHPGGTVLGEYTNGLQNQSPYVAPALSQTYSQSPSMQYASPKAPAQVPPIVTSLGPSSRQPTTHTKQPIVQQPFSATQSPWGANDDNAPRRPAAGPGSFDQNAFPTASNTTSARTAPTQSSSWARTTQGSLPASVVDEQSPWHIASQSIVDDGWGAPPNSLTVDNLGQHNQQQEREEALHKRHEEPSPVESTELIVEQAPPEVVPVLPTPDATPPATSKGRRPSTARLAPTPTTAPSPLQEAKSPSIASSAVPAKPVWSTAAVEEEKKTTNITPSLREIQEAETKKQDARKAAERERERAARASQGTAPVPAEEAQPFTASWGLPTSKVGSSRSISIPTVKESATSTPATSVAANSPAPVWTNGNKPHAAKKTMKEIQEEEEKRKKLAAKDTVAAAAARRAYAETTTKSPQPSQAAGSAWTTVGSNGKLSTPAATVRPAVTPSVSAAAATPVRATSATPAARPVVPAAVKTAPAAAKVEETPIAPSTDFMKWLTDSLKGLNSSVNFEEIMSMLLTFPLDVDSTTKEIISELIYANSTTLDGRRFAEEFVSKRKADAVSRKGAGKQPSIADVLKAQPKPSQQSEWGGFKVVNKKKKGGRA